MELTPIKVKITLTDEGHAKYPNFNAIDASIRQNMDWSKYIDSFGSGWIYDKDSGHKDSRSEGNEFDSPHGQQWGIILVPDNFANAAKDVFPGEVEIIDEDRAENFYNNYHGKHLPDEIIDTRVLEGIKMKQDLGIELTAEQAKAIDPTDTTPGIRKNMRKTFADFKSMKGITLPVPLRKKAAQT